MQTNLDTLFRPLEAVKNDEIMKVAEKLKKSRNRAEQAVARFLQRVCVFREEGPDAERERYGSSFTSNHGLQHLQD